MTESEEWLVRVCIELHPGPGVLTKSYDSTETYPDKEEADRKAIEFGQQIIDGRCPGLSLPE